MRVYGCDVITHYGSFGAYQLCVSNMFSSAKTITQIKLVTSHAPCLKNSYIKTRK